MFYLYKNPETGEVREVWQRMLDEHVYEDEGVQWVRVFTSPQAAIDTKIDPFSKEKFLEKTNKAGTVGELWDRSREFSERRADITGEGDPVKKEYKKKYEAERGGKSHPDLKD